MSDIGRSLKHLTERLRDRRAREIELTSGDGTMDIITQHIANGGTLVTLCEQWDVNYGAIAAWINRDKLRSEMLSNAFLLRSEWAKERVLLELRMLAHFDIRKILGPDSEVLPPEHWPSEIARAVESLEIHEINEKDSETGEKIAVGTVKKVKLASKLRALELLGKTEAMFVEKHQVKVGVMTLAELVDASWSEDDDDERPVEESYA